MEAVQTAIVVEDGKTQLKAMDAKEKTIQKFVEKGLDRDLIKTAWEIHAPDLNPAEFYYFLNTCQAIGANPLKREIFPIKFKDKLTLVVADAFLERKAKEDTRFDCVIGDVVRVGQEFSVSYQFHNGWNVPVVNHKMTAESLHLDKEIREDKWKNKKEYVSNILGAWAIGYRRDASPYFFFADWSVYDATAKNDIWAKYPTSMILKCARSYVLKRLFCSDNDLHTEAEMANVDMTPNKIDSVKEKIKQLKSQNS